MTTCSCGKDAELDERHDAYYCPDHGWLEPTCGDADCYYCSTRPERPAPLDLPPRAT